MNWTSKRVLVTGHTGFKGSWLSLWLQQKGAALCGIALEPAKDKSMFEDANVGCGMRSVIGDIRNLELLKKTFVDHRPEIVFHLAAQPLVRSSYEDPLGTYSTNVMGTVNLLESVRKSEGVRAVVVVTSDKCYENREWEWPYRETDRLGGYDPYSLLGTCGIGLSQFIL
jgi:CDP-glucose 4,6-dehydratase